MKEMEKLLIFKRLFEFSKWLLHHTNKFPKSHRFSVAVKLENSILEMIELITQANMSQKKMGFIISAHIRPQRSCRPLRSLVLLRLSYEMEFINLKSYEYGAKELVEIGKMLGGWMKQQR